MREPYELAAELAELRRRDKHAPKASLARQVGCGRSYASKLLKLVEDLDPPVLGKWCVGWIETEAVLHVGVEIMIAKVAVLPKSEQDAMYEELRKSGTVGRGAGGGRKPSRKR